MKSNRKKYYIVSSLSSIFTVFTQGSIVNSFLMNVGLSENEVSLYASLSSVVQVIIMSLLFLFADKVGKIINKVALSSFLLSIFHTVMAFVAFFKETDTHLLVVIVMLNAVLLNFILGMKTIFDYKLVYYIIDVSEISSISGMVGFISNILVISVSALFSFLTTALPYRDVIGVCFVASALLSIAAALVTKSYVPVNGQIESTQKNVGLLEVLKNKATYILFFPNLIRGIASGIFALSAVIMLAGVSTSETSASFLSTVLAVSGTIACFIFSIVTRRVSCPTLILFGAILFLPAMSLMPLFSESAFMIFYFIASFGMMFVDYAIPSYIYMTVPSGIMARYSSIRMLTHNAGIAIGSALTGVLLSAGLPAIATLIAGALELIVGIVYFLFSKSFGKTLRYSV